MSNYTNSIDYIKGSVLCNSNEYAWVRSLITSTLDDNFNITVLESLLKPYFADYLKPITEGITPDDMVFNSLSLSSITHLPDIKTINSIDEIVNLGLVNVTNQIKLTPKLNIFFGDNGCGKSTIFSAMCKTLGKNRNAFPNINQDVTNSTCSIQVTTVDDKIHTIKWNNKVNNPSQKIKYFDNILSTYLINLDQTNEFELSHLKNEYFIKLQFNYDLIEKCLNSINQNSDTEMSEIALRVKPYLPNIFDDSQKLTANVIEGFTFTSEDEANLSKAENRKALLLIDKAQLIKTLRSANLEINKILESLGSIDLFSSNAVWESYYDKAYISDINEKIEEYNSTKSALQELSSGTLSLYINKDWVDDEKWLKFISDSIKFINSLSAPEKEIYNDKKCVYCQQILSEESRKLVSSYNEIQNDYQSKIETIDSELEQNRETIDRTIQLLEKYNLNKKIIIDELGHINKTEKDLPDSLNIGLFLQSIKAKITNHELINIELEPFNVFFNGILGLNNDFSSLIKQEETSTTSNALELADVKLTISRLQEKKKLFEHKNDIKRYKELADIKVIIKVLRGNLSPLRSTTSRLFSKFSNDSAIHAFRVNLTKEYDYFRFEVPSKFSLKPTSPDGVNKRMYGLGDHRLGDIFSEGERKIHSLADFFAESTLQKYKGVYIFDDPVNSLDANKIHLVAKRVRQLVSEGNQVIVFTHNIFFLYDLVHGDDTLDIKIVKNKRSNIVIESSKMNKLDNLINTFREIGKLVNEIVKKDEDDVTHFEIANVYSLMCGYMEEYLEVKVFRDTVNRYRRNIRMDGLKNFGTIDRSVFQNIYEFWFNLGAQVSKHSQPKGSYKADIIDLENDHKHLIQNYNYK